MMPNENSYLKDHPLKDRLGVLRADGGCPWSALEASPERCLADLTRPFHQINRAARKPPLAPLAGRSGLCGRS